jgi:hypothetical protein
MNAESSQQILENTQASNFIKIRTAGSTLFHADRWTGRQTVMIQLIFALCNFEKHTSNGSGQRQVVGCFAYSNETSGSIKCGEFVDWLRTISF